MKLKLIFLFFCMIFLFSCYKSRTTINGVTCNIKNETGNRVYLWYQFEGGILTQYPIIVEKNGDKNIILTQVDVKYSFISSTNSTRSTSITNTTSNQIKSGNKVAIKVTSASDPSGLNLNVTY